MQNVRRRTRATEADRSDGPSGRGRGRPRAFDRQIALDAAMRLFWRKGFAATSISDLTEAMGIGSPSLYAAFGSKEELFAEAVRRFSDVATPLIWGPLDNPGPVRDAVEAFLLAAAAVFPATVERPGGCMVTLSAAGQEGCTTVGELVSAGRAEGVRRIERRLAQGVAEGQLPADTDNPSLARYVLAVQQGMSVQARDGASRQELEGIVHAAMARWPA